MFQFMKLQVYRKGSLYSADCSKCGMTHYAHEWVADDINGERDAMQNGTLRCNDCGGSIDADTFMECGRQYAARYSAPGYLDCTEFSFGKNRQNLERELRDMYGPT